MAFIIATEFGGQHNGDWLVFFSVVNGRRSHSAEYRFEFSQENSTSRGPIVPDVSAKPTKGGFIVRFHQAPEVSRYVVSKCRSYMSR